MALGELPTPGTILAYRSTDKGFVPHWALLLRHWYGIWPEPDRPRAGGLGPVRRPGSEWSHPQADAFLLPPGLDGYTILAGCVETTLQDGCRLTTALRAPVELPAGV